LFRDFFYISGELPFCIQLSQFCYVVLKWELSGELVGFYVVLSV